MRTSPSASSIIVDSELIDLGAAEVRRWEETGLFFEPPYAPERTEKARYIVVHWTASERTGEAGAAQIRRSLMARRLSVEFAITNEGTIWQYVDPALLRCKHAARANRFSIGIEVSNTGWLSSNKHLHGSVAKRRQYEATIHGWRTRFFDFFPAQQRALNRLVAGLVEAMDIEPRVLTAPWERRPTIHYQNDMSGICGHLHVASYIKRHPKCDPGTAPLEALKRYLAEKKTD